MNVESVEYYEKRLRDKEFRWHGPTSCEDRIPVLHAARALAYLGDPAVPALLRALRDESISKSSIIDALSEIGLPANDYSDCDGLSKWWEANGEVTIAERSEHRHKIGLPRL